MPTLRHNAAAASWSALSCSSSANVGSRSSLLALLRYSEAWLEHVAQLDEKDALLVAAQRRERHRGARRVGVELNARSRWSYPYYLTPYCFSNSPETISRTSMPAHCQVTAGQK